MQRLIYLLISNLIFTVACFGQFDVTSSVTNLASLKALNINGPYKSVFVRGKTNLNDGWQGLFIYSAASTLPADDGMAIQPDSGGGRWIRQYSGNDFPLTWIDSFPNNTHLIAMVSFISSNAPGGTIWLPSQTMPINPVTNNISWKNNVNLIWNAGSQFVLDFIPNTNWCFITVTNVSNAYFGNPTVVGVTNTPGSVSNYGRGFTILQSTNIIVDNPDIRSWYSDPFFMGDDVSTNGNIAVNFYNVPEVIANSNASTEMATYRPYKRVRSTYELVRLDVSREDILAELASSSDTSLNGFFQYFSDRTDTTNATSVFKPLNAGGRYLRITPYLVGTNGTVINQVSGLGGGGTVPHVAYFSGPTNLSDAPITIVNDTATFKSGFFVGTNSSTLWGDTMTEGESLVSIANVSNGDINWNGITLKAFLDDTNFSMIHMSTSVDDTQGAYFDLQFRTNTIQSSTIAMKAQGDNVYIQSDVAGILGFDLNPGNFDDGVYSAYTFNSYRYRTNNSAPFLIVKNFLTNLFSIFPDGSISRNSGDIRGANSVDLQMNRSSSSMVASGASSVIIGGTNNTASAIGSVAGGRGNTVSGIDAVGFGLSNTAIGDGSFVVGSSTYAAKKYSVATGFSSLAANYGEMAHSAFSFADAGDAQESVLVAANQTSNSIPVTLFLNGTTVSERMVLQSNSTWAFSILITARRTDANGENASYKLEGTIHTDGTALSTTLDALTKTVIFESNAAWDVTVTADTSNRALIITVTGENGKTINWVAVVNLSITSG